jgi:hypothetical protein
MDHLNELLSQHYVLDGLSILLYYTEDIMHCIVELVNLCKQYLFVCSKMK